MKRPVAAAPVRHVAAAAVVRGDVAAVVAFVEAQVGEAYVHGGVGPQAWDCSGLLMVAFGRVGVRLPHDADAIGRMGKAVSRAELRPGDVVVYSGHVGIFVGGGMMVAAANPREGVVRQAIYGTPTGYRRLVG